ncbi:hypothetical protein COV88_03540 [Candidatus Saccharibacteria bacterium CG11_big_fil_rev_8_21_14_0_20_41_19]|nr:MAG: hypothetical protein AUK57_01565 [Candidatus Saccharibacteria bacterium CG2_30_41_52]PIQ70662.1 MAG: hypothetical protein COV88_03540 [Candidatus Saccharibacteria bacterium CG11_big_fil_rev_8_21_14_0_20_41_19]PIZ59580.1 MAG: hypothetical protein COY18_03065 [Candidatus Saccharibacteria bacterium CG_4_10_14_0_2_um_filter_41_11]PJC29763.1 MAG: hypothetical protein CO052_01775 [Candidatus Saccharibacteria bacterium CG_4_9_14_0_2_um_filter_41_9]PJE66218.1 MAG: hypothetical protein COU92_018
MAFMEIILVIVFLASIYIAIKKTLSVKQARQKKVYQYQAKEYFMTKSESEFFRMLVNVANDRYFIFPQAHLSAILDEKIKGQNWKYAFRHINGKSVDYVLCDKITLKPTYAVELDDYTHEYADRQERDKEVERMLQCAGIPLVRFSDYKTLNQEDIAKRFFEAHNT